MVENGITQARGEFAATFETSFKGRVLNAEPIHVLSDRDDKLVEIVRDTTGARFVRRSYSKTAVSNVERVGLSFNQAWDTMHACYAAAGIKVVPSAVLHPSRAESAYPVVVAAEYVQDSNIRDASESAKEKLAAGLGKLMGDTANKYFPSAEAYRPDMFRVEKDDSGEDRLVLVDIDPHLASWEDIRTNIRAVDQRFAFYLSEVALFLQGSLCKPNEKYPVMGAFIQSMGPVLRELGVDGEDMTLMTLMNLNAVSQGVDLKI